MEVEDAPSDILSHLEPPLGIQLDLALWSMEDMEERALGNVLADNG